MFSVALTITGKCSSSTLLASSAVYSCLKIRYELVYPHTVQVHVDFQSACFFLNVNDYIPSLPFCCPAIHGKQAVP